MKLSVKPTLRALICALVVAAPLASGPLARPAHAVDLRGLCNFFLGPKDYRFSDVDPDNSIHLAQTLITEHRNSELKLLLEKNRTPLNWQSANLAESAVLADNAEGLQIVLDLGGKLERSHFVEKVFEMTTKEELRKLMTAQWKKEATEAASEREARLKILLKKRISSFDLNDPNTPTQIAIFLIKEGRNQELLQLLKMQRTHSLISDAINAKNLVAVKILISRGDTNTLDSLAVRLALGSTSDEIRAFLKPHLEHSRATQFERDEREVERLIRRRGW